MHSQIEHGLLYMCVLWISDNHSYFSLHLQQKERTKQNIWDLQSTRKMVLLEISPVFMFTQHKEITD